MSRRPRTRQLGGVHTTSSPTPSISSSPSTRKLETFGPPLENKWDNMFHSHKELTNQRSSFSGYQPIGEDVDFNVWTARGNTGVFQCFTDIAHSLADSLRGLGYKVAETNGIIQKNGRVIIVGGNVLRPQEAKFVPPNAIIYQLEQTGSHWIGGGYLKLLQSHIVWDFSSKNSLVLKQLGCGQVHLCRIGYSPNPVKKLEKAKDIDVLFLGAANERRKAILNQLRTRGVNVHDSGAWGENRRDLVARSKIVLNVHFFNDSVLEMVRLGPILEQGAFIVSESGSDREMDAPFEEGMKIVPYGNLVETVMSYLGRADERDVIARQGTAIFSARTQKAEVARCLEEMGYKKSIVKCYIINRDRLTWTKRMVEEIRRLGGEPIILDNASSYPPLLEWYASADCRVVRLGKNFGSRAAWLSGVVDKEVARGEKYVVSDPDLDLSGVPSDTLSVLSQGLDRFGVTKAGLSLEITDVPRELLNVKQVDNRTLEQIEIGYWRERLDGPYYRADVDTTFAMYVQGRPLDGAKFYEGVRSDRPYTAKHLPWYRTEKDFDEEDRYYVSHRERLSNRHGTWYDSVVQASRG